MTDQRHPYRVTLANGTTTVLLLSDATAKRDYPNAIRTTMDLPKFKTAESPAPQVAVEDGNPPADDTPESPAPKSGDKKTTND